MTWTIAKKEILQNLRSFKFMVITMLIMVTVLVSIFIMYQDYKLRMENYEILKPSDSEPIAIVPPTPLSIFIKGLDGTLGRSYKIEWGGQIKVGSKQQSTNKLFRLFTQPDMLYIVKVIISLCAILFAFDMITGEKEAHTLSQLMSNSTSRTSLIIGKWLGGYISFIIPFAAVFLLGALAISLSPVIRFDSDLLIRFGLFFISSLLYLTFFFSLGLLISCLTYTSASSIVFSLFLWALIVFVVPNLGNTLARQFVKIPSVQQLEMKCEHIWIKAVFERITAGGTGNRLETWNNLRKRLRLGLTYWEILLAFNILFFAGAFVKFIRYDVR